MSKNIAISDAVYAALRRRKGPRSFSETIDAALHQGGGGIADVAGMRILDDPAQDEAAEDLRRAGRATSRRIASEAP